MPNTNRIFRLTEEKYRRLNEDNGGYCVECGEEASGVEPDACGYQCDFCDANGVYGLEELLIMGQVEIVD